MLKIILIVKTVTIKINDFDFLTEPKTGKQE